MLRHQSPPPPPPPPPPPKWNSGHGSQNAIGRERDQTGLQSLVEGILTKRNAGARKNRMLVLLRLSDAISCQHNDVLPFYIGAPKEAPFQQMSPYRWAERPPPP